MVGWILWWHTQREREWQIIWNRVALITCHLMTQTIWWQKVLSFRTSKLSKLPTWIFERLNGWLDSVDRASEWTRSLVFKPSHRSSTDQPITHPIRGRGQGEETDLRPPSSPHRCSSLLDQGVTAQLALPKPPLVDDSLSPRVRSQLNSCNVHKLEPQFHIFLIDSPGLAFWSFHWSLREIAVKGEKERIIRFSVTFLCKSRLSVFPLWQFSHSNNTVLCNSLFLFLMLSSV